MRIPVHEKIIIRVQELIGNHFFEDNRVPDEEIRKALKNFINTKLYSFGCKKLNSYYGNGYGLGKDVIRMAWNQNIGAHENFRDLLCYFGFSMNWGETLKSLRIKLPNEGINQPEKTEIPPDKSKEDDSLEKGEEEYSRYILQECGYIKFVGISKEIQIGTAFIPRQLYNYDAYWEYYGLPILSTVNLKTPKKYSVSKLISDEKSFVIVAGPGNGKTNILKSIAIAIALPQLGKIIYRDWNHDSLLPVFVRCRDLADYTISSVMDCINRHLKRTKDLKISYLLISSIKEALKDSNLVLLIDGIDEITDNRKRKLFLKQLRKFNQSHNNISIIVTCREASLTEISDILCLKRFLIPPLEEDEIKELIIRWLISLYGELSNKELKGKLTDITEKTIDNFRRTPFKSNPLFLSMLLLISNDPRSQLPESEIALFERVTKELVKNWNIDGYGDMELHYFEAIEQLAYVAYCMTQSDQRIISDDKLIEYLEIVRARMNRRFDHSVEEFINTIEIRTGLWKKSSDSKYEFDSYTIQEYFTAIAIAKKYLPKEHMGKNPSEILTALLSSKGPGIFDVLIYTCSLIGNESMGFLKNIITAKEKLPEEVGWRNRNSHEDIMFEITYGLKPSMESHENRIFQLLYLLNKLIVHNVGFEEIESDILNIYSENYIDTPALRRDILSVINNNKKYLKLLFTTSKTLFFKEQGGLKIVSLFELLTILSNVSFEISKLDDFLESIESDVLSDNKETSCMGLFKVNTVRNYILHQIKQIPAYSLKNIDGTEIINASNKLNSTFKLLYLKKSLTDPHYFTASASAIISFHEFLFHSGSILIRSMPSDAQNNKYVLVQGSRYLHKLIDENIKHDYLKVFVNGWLNYKDESLRYIASKVLLLMLHPGLKFNFIREFPKIESFVKTKYYNPHNLSDKMTAAYICILLKIDLDSALDELKENFR